MTRSTLATPRSPVSWILVIGLSRESGARMSRPGRMSRLGGRDRSDVPRRWQIVRPDGSFGSWQSKRGTHNAPRADSMRRHGQSVSEVKPRPEARGAARLRLAETGAGTAQWDRWGPYLAERQWGTVREDYSADGTAWD